MNTPLVESFADAMFEIGKNLASKSNFPMATKWLERSYDVINTQEIEELSRQAVELRLAILQALVNAHLNGGTDDDFKKAENYVAYMESHIGDKFTVLLLRLEMLLKTPAEVFDSNAFAGILRRMIRNTELSDTTLKIILHHIHTLNDKSPTLASEVLDYFFGDRVLPSQHEEWIEKATVFRTQIAITARDTVAPVESLMVILDAVEHNVHQPLGVPATFSIHMVRC